MPEGEGRPGGRGPLGRLGHLRDVAIGLDTLEVATADTDQPDPVSLPDHMPIPYGVRVPTFVVSPWVPPGKGPSVALDHCSIVKTVLARFLGADKPFLSERVAASHSFESFLSEPQPRMDIEHTEPLAPLPDTVRRVAPGGSQIITPLISRKRLREEPVEFHDLSGWVARLIGR